MKDKLFIISLIIILLSVGWLLLEIRRGTYIQNTCPNYISKEVSQPALIYNLILCESNWRPNVYGDNGLAFGLAQFHKPTFEWFCDLSGKDLNYYNPEHQIELLFWALENNLGHHWRTCYEKLTN